MFRSAWRIVFMTMVLSAGAAVAQEACTPPGPAPDCSKPKIETRCGKYSEKYQKDFIEWLGLVLQVESADPLRGFAQGTGGTCCEKRLLRSFVTIREFGGESARTFQFTITKSFLRRDWFENKPPQCNVKNVTIENKDKFNVCIRVTYSLFGGIQFRIEPCDHPEFGAVGTPRFTDSCEIKVTSGDLRRDICCIKPEETVPCAVLNY